MMWTNILEKFWLQQYSALKQQYRILQVLPCIVELVDIFSVEFEFNTVSDSILADPEFGPVGNCANMMTTAGS